MKKTAFNSLRALAAVMALLSLAGYVAFTMGYFRIDPALFPWNAEDYRSLDAGDPHEPRLIALIMDEDIENTYAEGSARRIDPSRLENPMPPSSASSASTASTASSASWQSPSAASSWSSYPLSGRFSN